MKDSKSILQQYWGYDSFRSPQGEVIDAVILKNDTIALLPTGGGKSVCFQVPALMLEGKTLVISPLIALMQDQVSSLIAKGIKAKSLNANMSYREIDGILDNFVFGDLKILYISPERITSEVFAARIARTKLSLIAIDEAHCISQWGYDFRPSYFNIPTLREIHPNVPIIALTATATDKVIHDIAAKLEMKSPKIFKKSFARTNLGLTVIKSENKRSDLIQILSRVKGCTIIYVRNRKQTIEVGQWLTNHGISCVSYHGGMDRNMRERNQQAWMDNKVRMMVSTNAFGMGIDKPDVRLVVHLDVAPSLEEYYQEAGRAGRDGKESYAVTIIDDVEIKDAFAFLEDQYPTIEFIENIYDHICRYYKVAYGSGFNETFDFNIINIADYIKLHIKRIYHTLDILEKEGWIHFTEAYKQPSKLMILVAHHELYFLDRKSTVKDEILTHLLRKYEGLFIDPVNIDETKIASELKIDETQLVQYLHLLRSEGIISYQPRAAAPQIIFTQPRPGKGNFGIDRKLYLERKERAKIRLEAMLKFLEEEEICRQKVIVSYFGEKGQDCGKCDICLGSNKYLLTAEQIQQILEHVKKSASQQPLFLQQYITQYPFNKRKRVTNAIRQLESEGLVQIDNNGLIRVNTGQK